RMTPEGAIRHPGTGGDPFLARHLPGTSVSVARLRELVSQLNSTRGLELARVLLIQGEIGAGKSHLARVIAAHRKWIELRAGSDPSLDAALDAFTEHYGEIAIPNLPDALIESELFGYKRGAFTGALRDRPGLLGGPGAGRGYNDVLLD